MASEIPLIVGETDIGKAQLSAYANIPMNGEKGYSRPECQYCPQPQYSDDGFHEKVQGPVVLSLVVMPDGTTQDVSLSKGWATDWIKNL
jgi:hypothetical protein